MKKFLFLLVAVIFVSACSTTNYTKKTKFNGDRLTYAHKDVVKSEVPQADETVYVSQNEIKKAKEESNFVADIQLDKLSFRKAIRDNFTREERKEIKKAAKEIKANAELNMDAYEMPQLKEAKKAVKKTTNVSNRIDRNLETLLLILAVFLLPFGTILAVGYVNDWDIMPMVYNFLWLLLCGLPGLIHALIHIFRRR